MASVDTPTRHPPLYFDAASGALAGVIAATFVCPLDVLKARLHVHGLPVSANVIPQGRFIVTSLVKIFRNEGYRGMYCGLSPTIFALLFNNAIYFPIYQHLKSVFSSDGIIDEKRPLPVGANGMAAAFAGAAANILTNPLWVVKIRLQSTQGKQMESKPYKGTFSALRTIARKEGIRRGLYSGVVPALAGVSHPAIYFPTYERIKHYLANRNGSSIDELPARDVVLASSASKIFASTLTYPHEVIRSRLQEQGQHQEKRYSGVVDCVRKVYHEDGIKGFYRGCATNLLRTVPANVITLTSYEMINRFLVNSFHQDTQSRTH